MTESSAGKSPATGEPEGAEREPARLEAFSDGVMAVIITIMVLDIHAPAYPTLKSLGQRGPSLLVYVLSFAFVGIYWNNHHHLLRATRRISPMVMWANLHLLFWLSLVPIVTSWVGGYYRAHLPASAYGAVGFMCGVAYTILTVGIIRANGGADSEVARGIGSDTKAKLSLLLYSLGIVLAWVTPWVSYGLYVAVSLMWFVPDRRLDRPSSEAVSP